MNEQQLAAVKQALEVMRNQGDVGVDEWIAAEAALQSIISQDALHKMAEDAVTIGLSYNDWPKIGCVNHDCDQCKAVQEPSLLATLKAVQGTLIAANEQGQIADTIWFSKYETLFDFIGAEIDKAEQATPPAPQPVPVKTYHDGKPWPVAPKPWVGLTDEELQDLMAIYSGVVLYRAIEDTLRERNT
jgi:hypothetical protein